MSMYAINEIDSYAVLDPVTGGLGAGGLEATPLRPRLRLLQAPTRVPGRRSQAVFWRRRIAVALAATILVLAARAAVSWSPAGPAQDEQAPPPAVGTMAPVSMAPVSQTSHVVERGDTLWGLARSLQPRGDVRPLVDRLATSRHGRPLHVGERITLPEEP